MLDISKMSEAEVSLELALYLIKSNKVNSDVKVAIDGAQIKTGTSIHFAIDKFLLNNKCVLVKRGNEWRGTYKVDNYDCHLVIHSNPGQGDVVAKLENGKILKVESKKGPLISKPGSPEYPLLREAIGQLMTIEDYNGDDILAVAVPYSKKFSELSGRWANAPLIKKLGIRFILVARDGAIKGLEDL